MRALSIERSIKFTDFFRNALRAFPDDFDAVRLRKCSTAKIDSVSIDGLEDSDARDARDQAWPLVREKRTRSEVHQSCELEKSKTKLARKKLC